MYAQVTIINHLLTYFTYYRHVMKRIRYSKEPTKHGLYDETVLLAKQVNIERRFLRMRGLVSEGYISTLVKRCPCTQSQLLSYELVGLVESKVLSCIFQVHWRAAIPYLFTASSCRVCPVLCECWDHGWQWWFVFNTLFCDRIPFGGLGKSTPNSIAMTKRSPVHEF